MDMFFSVILAIHLVSVAAIVGGWFAHFRHPTVTTSQWWGAIGAVVTGLVMFGMAMTRPEADHAWLGVKLLVGVLIFVAAMLGRRRAARDGDVPTGLAHAVGGLGLINILVATLWH